MLTTMGMDYLAGEVCTLLMELLTGGPCESCWISTILFDAPLDSFLVQALQLFMYDPS